jgi:hypothetical protein
MEFETSKGVECDDESLVHKKMIISQAGMKSSAERLPDESSPLTA